MGFVTELAKNNDVGYGASNTFGGPVPTPTIDRLAKNGLCYTQFHSGRKS